MPTELLTIIELNELVADENLSAGTQYDVVDTGLSYKALSNVWLYPLNMYITDPPASMYPGSCCP